MSCAALASPAATYGCQAADVATTALALHRGATEANPIMGAVLERTGLFGLALVKVGLAVLLIRYATERERAAVNVASCGVALHNLAVVR